MFARMSMMAPMDIVIQNATKHLSRMILCHEGMANWEVHDEGCQWDYLILSRGAQ